MALTVLGASCAAPGPGDSHESAPPPTPADRVKVSDASDPQAIEVAQAVMEKMGGWDKWDATRFVKWRFFGRRLHYWDRQSGDIRIEGPFGSRDEPKNLLILMNIHTKEGRVWSDGEPLTDAEQLTEALGWGHEAWVNDSYWMFMPYKLLDPGVTLKYSGERALEDGRAADVLDLTFADGIGYTPKNRYEVFVAKDTGLVEQWAFFSDAADEEPRFTMPWTGWSQHGEILLASSRGRDADWEIAVYDDLPSAVFQDPDPVP